MVGPLSWLPLMVQPRPGVGVALGAVGVAVAFVLGVVGMFMLGGTAVQSHGLLLVRWIGKAIVTE